MPKKIEKTGITAPNLTALLNQEINKDPNFNEHKLFAETSRKDLNYPLSLKSMDGDNGRFEIDTPTAATKEQKKQLQANFISKDVTKFHIRSNNNQELIIAPPMRDGSAIGSMSTLPLHALANIVKYTKDKNQSLKNLYIGIPLALSLKDRKHWAPLFVHIDLENNKINIHLQDSQPWLIAKLKYRYTYEHIKQQIDAAVTAACQSTNDSEDDVVTFDIFTTNFVVSYTNDQWNSYDCGRWTLKYLEDFTAKAQANMQANKKTKVIPSFFARNKGTIISIVIGVLIAAAFLTVLILSHGAAAAILPVVGTKVAAGTTAAAGIKLAAAAVVGFFAGALSRFGKIFKRKPKEFKTYNQELNTIKNPTSPSRGSDGASSNTYQDFQEQKLLDLSKSKTDLFVSEPKQNNDDFSMDGDDFNMDDPDSEDENDINQDTPRPQ